MEIFHSYAWLQIAAAYGVYGPYHGTSAAIPIWKVEVEPNEFCMNYLLIASPHDRSFTPIKGKDPPDINNQIAVGIAVSTHQPSWTQVFTLLASHLHSHGSIILLQAYPSVLGDDNPRLYIYSTVSTYSYALFLKDYCIFMGVPCIHSFKRLIRKV